MNPFLAQTYLNIPLSLEQCQRIHFSALQQAAYRPAEDWAKTDILPKAYAQEGLLRHPGEIARIFSGVTTEVYAKIESLYCDRLGLSIKVVYQILGKMAKEAGVTPIDYEAVWAICQHLHWRRQESLAIETQLHDTTWQIFHLLPRVQVMNDDIKFYPHILCIMDRSTTKPIAYRIFHPDHLAKEIARVTYYGLVAGRTPSQFAPTGLVWAVPAQVTVSQPISEYINDTTLKQIGIQLVAQEEIANQDHPLYSNWDKDLQGRTLSKTHLEWIFDGLLEHLFTFGPLTDGNKIAYEFRNLFGYSQDPASQFPVLQKLLPVHQSTIEPDGSVEFDGLHYEHNLLKYWPGAPVTLHRSEHAENTAWIYLDGAILCEAKARELRRQDGTYRPNRPERE